MPPFPSPSFILLRARVYSEVAMLAQTVLMTATVNAGSFVEKAETAPDSF